MKHVKYLIIGGGISALNFARNLNSDDFLIIEKDSTIGGLCRTHYNGEYVWDYAGHFFHFSNESLKDFFNSKLDQNDIITCKKNTKIIYKNRYIDYPFQKNIHQLEKEEFIECLYDLYFKENKNKFNDFEDMLYAKFGKSITEKFLKPYNEKLYACSLKRMDTDAMGRFFPYADIPDIIKNMKNSEDTSYNSSFEYPRKGAQVFIEALSSDINPEKILVSAEAKSVDIIKKEVVVEIDKKVETYAYEFLINTTPFNLFTKLCGISTEGKGISYNQVLVFNIGFDSSVEDTTSHWLYFPEREYCFYRVGFYNNILSKVNGSLYVELGFDAKQTFTDDLINEYYKKVIDDLIKCKIIKRQKVILYESLVINPGYVHITEDGKTFVSKMMNQFAEMNVYSIGRYGSWTYCSMEDCMLQANNLTKKIS